MGTPISESKENTGDAMKAKKHSKRIYFLTFLNIGILIMVLFCLWHLRQTLELINTTELPAIPETETDTDTVTAELPSGNTARIYFGKNAFKVKDCSSAASREDMIAVLCTAKAYCNQNNISVSRKNIDLIGEYRLHVFLYQIGYKREQTGNADIDYIQDHRQYVNIASRLFGIFGI